MPTRRGMTTGIERRATPQPPAVPLPEGGADPLTGLANQRSWDTALGYALRPRDRKVCVLLIDFDGFTEYSRAGGDQLLAEAAAAWMDVLRGEDLLARLGGGKFAVIIVGVPIDRAHAIAVRLLSTVPGAASVSVGIAAWDDVEPAEQLVARAEVALAEAKVAAGDRTAVAA
ncbi:MAG: GGDEF domain-containing protein [Solirubrobacteraceae bacterium]